MCCYFPLAASFVFCAWLKWIITIVIFLVTAIASAQQLQHNFRHLSPNNGLSNEVVNAVTQDKYGYIWLGTGFGLNRFDGVGLKQFFHIAKDTTTISDNTILSLYTDTNGTLWAGTQKNLSMYDYQSESFVRYLPGYAVTEMAEDKNKIIWVATNKGLKKTNTIKKTLSDIITPDTLLNRFLQNTITDLYYHTDGNLYIAGSFGVISMNTSTFQWKIFDTSASTGSLLKSNDVEAVAVDALNQLWIATDHLYSKLHKINAERTVSVVYEYFQTPAEKKIPNRILNLLPGAGGKLWISTTDFGLTMYESSNGKFTRYMRNPLQSGSIAGNQGTGGLFADKSGVIWFGLNGYGVDYFYPGRMIFSSIQEELFQPVTLLSNWARAAAEDDENNLWLATSRGVSVLNKEKGVIKNISNSKEKLLHAPSVRALLNDGKGNMWIGTSSGINKYKSATGTMRFYGQEDGVPNMFVHCLYKTASGKLFAGGNDGLFEYLPATDKFYSYRNNPVLKEAASNVIKTIREDKKGRLWVGTFQNGVYVYDPAVSKIILHVREDSEYALSNNQIQSLFEDSNGMMWIGTRDGLNCFNITSGKNRVYKTEDGLPNNWICGLQSDKQGRLWIGTGNGLCVMTSHGKIIHRFGITDGLPNAQLNDQDAFATHDGNFVFPSRKGFLVFNPADFNWDEKQPAVYISSIHVLGSPVSQLKNIEGRTSLTVKPNENFITIELRALDYLNPTQCWYAYKLDGFDRDWIYTHDPVAKYTNIPGGKYVFRYKASNGRYDWSIEEKQFLITVKTAFYKTWWFATLLMILLASGIFLYMRWRINNTKKLSELKGKAQLLEKEKALVMYEGLKQQLNPHFLFNSLTSLNSLILDNPKIASSFLDSLSKTYRYILKSRDSETVALGDEIKFAENYIKLQQTRFERGFHVQINVPDKYYHNKIVPVTLQNLIENAIKHNIIDADTPLIIHIHIKDEYLIVENNLQRKTFVETSNKQGLSNLQSLYSYLSNRPMEIKEENNLFIIKIPLL